MYCVCQAFGSSETAKHRGNVVEIGCFIIDVLFRQIAGSPAISIKRVAMTNFVLGRGWGVAYGDI